MCLDQSQDQIEGIGNREKSPEKSGDFLFSRKKKFFFRGSRDSPSRNLDQGIKEFSRRGSRNSASRDRGSGIGDRGSGIGDRGSGIGDRGSGIGESQKFFLQGIKKFSPSRDRGRAASGDLRLQGIAGGRGFKGSRVGVRYARGRVWGYIW